MDEHREDAQHQHGHGDVMPTRARAHARDGLATDDEPLHLRVRSRLTVGSGRRRDRSCEPLELLHPVEALTLPYAALDSASLPEDVVSIVASADLGLHVS